MAHHHNSHHDHQHGPSHVRKIQRVCYVVASVLGILTCYFAIVAIAFGQTHVVSGVVRDESAQYAHTSGGGRSGAPPSSSLVYTIVFLSGDDTKYRITWSDFPKSQSQVSTQAGAHIRLWYTQAPFFGTDVVALQQLGSAGPVGPFVATPYFFDPNGRVLQFLPFIGALLFLTGTLAAMARTAPSWVDRPGQSSRAVLKQIQSWKR